MKLIILVALIFVISFSTSIRVGFYSANIEGYQYTQSDLLDVFNLFKVINGKKGKDILNVSVMKSNEVKNQNSDVFKNYDLILISLQETNASQDIQLKNMFMEDKDWQCHPMQYKNGFTKFVPKLTAVAMCNNKTKLKYIFDKTPFIPLGLFGSVIPTDLKAVFGRCFEDLTSKSKNDVLCFLGGHLETDLINGAKRIGRLFKFIENKVKNRPYNFYVLGDLNVRNWIKIDKDNVDKLKSDFEANKLSSYITGDTQAQIGFQSELSKTIDQKSHFFSFVGNDNLRALPFTYNYHVPKPDTDVSNFDTKHFRFECATQYKKAVEGKYVSNYGWLDRLGCGYNKLKGTCNIKGGDENVNYFMVPFLRKADHMPMIGSFEINSEGTKDEKLDKKDNISLVSSGSVKDLINKFESIKDGKIESKDIIVDTPITQKLSNSGSISKKSEVKVIEEKGKIIGKSSLSLDDVKDKKTRKLKVNNIN